MRLHSPSCDQHALSTRQAAVTSPLAAAAAIRMVPRQPARCSASRSADASTDEQSDAPKPRMRRTRLFKASDSSESPAAPAPAEHSAEAARAAVPVSEEFKRAFEDLGVRPVGLNNLSRGAMHARREAATSDDESFGSSSSRPSRSRDEQRWPQQQQQQQQRRRRQRQRYDYDEDTDDDRGSNSWRDRPCDSSSSRGRARYADDNANAPWLNRGRADRPKSSSSSSSSSAAAADRQMSRSSSRGSDALRQRWEQEAEERQRLAEIEEQKRLARKARSERIPTAPKPKQDKVIFQAITREWDEKATTEELRGARASARKIARVGIYDRNKSLRAVRRKALQNPAVKEDEEAARLAANAARQIQEAAALSIQPTREELYQAAAGVKRSFARAEALPEGEWERLKKQYRTIKTPIKIGRKGANPSLVNQVQTAWRGKEVVKLAVHDEKSARKMNLPRFNLLLQELEEKTGGVLIDAAGASIWLYRGVDWVPPPVPPPYKPPPQHELFTQEHIARGSWRDIAGISCYVVSSSEAAGLSSPPSSSSNSDAGGSSSSGDAMTVLLLPDQFSFQDSQLLIQMADRVASKGALVIMPDLLGPNASAPNSNVRTNGQTPATKAGGYWYVNQWPLVKKRKLAYMDWFNVGPGSWLQQRPRLLQLLEEMQQQGLYDKAAAAAAAKSSTADGSSSSEGAKQPSSSSSSSTGRPLGILGLGWGTYLGLQAAGDDECVAAGLHAVAAMSPVTFQKDYDLAKALQLPVALLPAKYDPMEQVMLTIDLLQPPYIKRCIFKRYGKIKPGWAHWLPQWIDNRAMYQAAEQMLMCVGWLKRELLGEDDDGTLPPPLSSADKEAAQQAAAEQAAAADAEEQEGAEEQDSEENDEE